MFKRLEMNRFFLVKVLKFLKIYKLVIKLIRRKVWLWYLELSDILFLWHVWIKCNEIVYFCFLIRPKLSYFSFIFISPLQQIYALILIRNVVRMNWNFDQKCFCNNLIILGKNKCNFDDFSALSNPLKRKFLRDIGIAEIF